MKNIHSFVAAGVVLIATVHVLDPPVIATINLERVFNDIQSRNQAETVLQAEIQVYETRRLELRTKAERAKEDLDLLVPGTDKYETVQKQHMQDVLDYSAMGEFIQYKLDATRAEARRQLFNEVIEEAARYARENGIDFIMTDDSSLAIQPGTDVQIVQQLALRRMIYVNEAFDITDALIAWINAP